MFHFFIVFGGKMCVLTMTVEGERQVFNNGEEEPHKKKSLHFQEEINHVPVKKSVLGAGELTCFNNHLTSAFLQVHIKLE